MLFQSNSWIASFDDDDSDALEWKFSCMERCLAPCAASSILIRGEKGERDGE